MRSFVIKLIGMIGIAGGSFSGWYLTDRESIIRKSVCSSFLSMSLIDIKVGINEVWRERVALQHKVDYSEVFRIIFASLYLIIIRRSKLLFLSVILKWTELNISAHAIIIISGCVQLFWNSYLRLFREAAKMPEVSAARHLASSGSGHWRHHTGWQRSGQRDGGQSPVVGILFLGKEKHIYGMY